MTPLDDHPHDCDRGALGRYAECFVPLSPDDENRAWVREHAGRPHGVLRTAMLDLLSPFMSLYDAHGLTGSYPMHLLSTGQLCALVGEGHERLLDVGAGAGFVTRYAEPLTSEIVCTETSRPLARRLERRGYAVFRRDIGVEPTEDLGDFDVVLCLNVLDRTPYPRKLLSALRSLCAAPTTLLVSIPLPLSPAVLVAGGSVDPLEPLPEARGPFEQGMRTLCEALFEPAGFEVDRLARTPYLSKGDRGEPLYVLDAALFVLRAAGTPARAR